MSQPHDTCYPPPDPHEWVSDVLGWLREIPELCALLPDAMVTRGGRGGVAVAAGSRTPCRLDVLDLADGRVKYDWVSGMDWVDPDRQGVLPYLCGWARDLEAEACDSARPAPRAVPEDPTVAEVCAWLIVETEWAAGLPSWPDYAHGVRRIWRRLRDATRQVRDVEPVGVPCVLCGGDLHQPRVWRCALCDMPVPTADVRGGAPTCTGCGHLADPVAARPMWECGVCGHRVTIQAVTLRDAAQIVGVPYSTLRRYAARPGALTPIRGDGAARLYDLGDIRGLVAEQRLGQVPLITSGAPRAQNQGG